MPDPGAMSEVALQNNVLALVANFQQVAYHTHISIRSQPGWPDLVIIGDHGVLFRELKTKVGRVSKDQAFMIEALRLAGADVDIWRPADWPVRITTELRAIGRSTAERPLPSQAELRRHLQGRGRRMSDAKKVSPGG